MYTFTTNLYQMLACFGSDVLLHCISVAQVFDLKRSARWLITPVWPMPSVRKHSLAVAREKGHVRDWQGRGATRLVGVTETAPEMGYFAQRGRGRN